MNIANKKLNGSAQKYMSIHFKTHAEQEMKCKVAAAAAAVQTVVV